jgi:hypothetical protein
LGDRHRIDSHVVPPCDFIAGIMKVPVMKAAERDREFIADLEADCAWLRKLQVMGIRW